MSENANNRAYERRPLTLGVRYITRSDMEATGRLLNISEGGLYMATDTDAEIGDEIIAYPEGLGRLSGAIVRKDEQGVAVQFNITDKQRQYLTMRISSALTGAPFLRLLKNRGHQRIGINLDVRARHVSNDEVFDCKIMDLSQSGAAIQSEIRPPIGEEISLGTVCGTVCRHTSDGFALTFSYSIAV